MQLIKWESLLDPKKLFEEIPELGSTGWDLATDVYEKGNNVVVEVQLPGIEADTYDISMEDGMLLVKGDREAETETEDKNYYRKEIQRGHFERRIQLPTTELVTEQLTSQKEDGVLRISIPKK